MPKSHPPYAASLRADAMALVQKRCKTIAAVAVMLGVSGESLRKSVQQAKVNVEEGPPGA